MYRMKNIIKGGSPFTVGEGETKTPVSEAHHVNGLVPYNGVLVAVTYEGAVTTGVTLAVAGAMKEDGEYTNIATTTLTTASEDKTVSVAINPIANQTAFPLPPFIKVLLSTGADDSIDLKEVLISEDFGG